MEYYILKNGEKTGPIKKEELKDNGISHESLVWTQGMDEWQKAGEVEELIEILSTMPPEPPRPAAPRFWMKRSVLATCCFLPLGIIGLINSIKAEEYYHKGLYELAELRAEDARKWALWGLFAFLAGSMMFITALIIFIAFGWIL